MFALADCCAGWNNTGEQKYYTRKDGIYKKCEDNQMYGGKGKNIEQTDGHIDTLMRNMRRKKSLFVGIHPRRNIQE